MNAFYPSCDMCFIMLRVSEDVCMSTWKRLILKIKHSLLNSIELKAKHMGYGLLEPIIHHHRRYVQTTYQGRVCVFMCSLSIIIIKKEKKKESHSCAFMEDMCGKVFFEAAVEGRLSSPAVLMSLIKWSTVSTQPWGDDGVQNHSRNDLTEQTHKKQTHNWNNKVGSWFQLWHVVL